MNFDFGFGYVFAIYFLGFWAPWLRYGNSATPVTTTWLELSGELSHLLPLRNCICGRNFPRDLFCALGTAFRLWGTAYIGGSVVQSGAMHARGVVAAGPYRHLRNPLYLGDLVFAMAVAILMPPTGAIFFLVASFVQMLRLILREEPYLEVAAG